VAHTVSVVAEALVLTWLYRSTGGSVLLPALFHGSGNIAMVLYDAIDPRWMPWFKTSMTVFVSLALVAIVGPGLGPQEVEEPSNNSNETGGAAMNGMSRRRLTVTGLLVLGSVLLATPVHAGDAWELITITRGAGWETNEARGTLKQTGQVLQGVLKDKTDGKADYEIRIELDGGNAKAHFRFISESDEGTTLAGSYSKAPAPTSTHCPEQIQLMNAFQYIGLARDACRSDSK
jgi:hypothetical protein